jgi:hypothetical protein
LAALAVCSLLLGCGSETTKPEAIKTEPGVPLAVERIASAILSPLDTPTYRVILDQESWAAAWSEFVAGHWPPPPPAPVVDFENRVVILAAAGALPTQLLAFRVDEVRLLNGVLHVTVREEWPAPQCGSLPVITRPVDIVSVPRLATQAQFISTRTSRC